MTVNIHEAKTNLSKLLLVLEKGEEVIIAKAGNPIAKLVSYSPIKKRVANSLKGKIILYDDLDSSNDEVLSLFENSF